ncbi:MAG: winged helix-turn-helix domain-containing protein [Bacteriovoracaceae bacterium]
MDSTSSQTELNADSVMALLANKIQETGLPLDVALAQSYYRLGKIYYDKSDLLAARECFLKTLEISKRNNSDGDFRYKVLGFLIRIASESMQMKEVELYVQESKEILVTLSQSPENINCEFYYNYGMLGAYQHNISQEQAREYFYKSYQKSLKENRPEIQAKALYALAANYFFHNDFPNAIKYLGNLNELLKVIDKKYIRATMFLKFARIYSDMGELNKALNYFDLSQKDFAEKSCWNLYGHILVGKALIHKKKGDYALALNYLQLAKESINPKVFKRLNETITNEINDVSDSSIGMSIDKLNRKIYVQSIGEIDFKHRFVLLEILFLLALKPGVYYTKEDLAQTIWKNEYSPLIHDKLIYTSISRLRKLLEPNEGSADSQRRYIIRGKDGYAYNPQIKVRFHKEVDVESDKYQNIDLTDPV